MAAPYRTGTNLGRWAVQCGRGGTQRDKVARTKEKQNEINEDGRPKRRDLRRSSCLISDDGAFLSISLSLSLFLTKPIRTIGRPGRRHTTLAPLDDARPR